MHELSIASSILESVLELVEKDEVKKVLEVRLLIGELMAVEQEQLRFCYTAITKETALEDSSLVIEQVEAAVNCPYCSYRGRPKYWEDALSFAPITTLQCPECGKAADPVQGERMCNQRDQVRGLTRCVAREAGDPVPDGANPAEN